MGYWDTPDEFYPFDRITWYEAIGKELEEKEDIYPHDKYLESIAKEKALHLAKKEKNIFKEQLRLRDEFYNIKVPLFYKHSKKFQRQTNDIISKFKDLDKLREQTIEDYNTEVKKSHDPLLFRHFFHIFPEPLVVFLIHPGIL